MVHIIEVGCVELICTHIVTWQSFPTWLWPIEDIQIRFNVFFYNEIIMFESPYRSPNHV